MPQEFAFIGLWLRYGFHRVESTDPGYSRGTRPFGSTVFVNKSAKNGRKGDQLDRPTLKTCPKG